MLIAEFEWDDANIDHLAEHGVEPEEAEEVFADHPIIQRSRDGRFIAWGQTWAGRYLMVVFGRKPGHVVRVVTARSMTQRERQRHRRRRT